MEDFVNVAKVYWSHVGVSIYLKQRIYIFFWVMTDFFGVLVSSWSHWKNKGVIQRRKCLWFSLKDYKHYTSQHSLPCYIFFRWKPCRMAQLPVAIVLVIPRDPTKFEYVNYGLPASHMPWVDGSTDWANPRGYGLASYVIVLTVANGCMWIVKLDKKHFHVYVLCMYQGSEFAVVPERQSLIISKTKLCVNADSNINNVSRIHRVL